MNKPVKVEAAPGRLLLDVLQQTIPFSHGLLLSTLPRASLQIVQPGKSSDVITKTYATEFQKEDKAAWQAVLHGRPVRGTEAWGAGFETSRFFELFLKPQGLRHVVAVPLDGAILDGYPAVAYLCRGPDESDFTDAEIRDVERVTPSAAEDLANARHSREPQGCRDNEPWSHRPSQRVYIFSADGSVVYPKEGIPLDHRLVSELGQTAKQAAEQAKKGPALADRVTLADTWGDLWVFRGQHYSEYPALGKGAFVFFCLQPDSCEWVAVRPADVQADPEIVRLLPTLKFMQQEFHQNPTLDDIAKKAHLSPFHFHRRFTDLIGQTPKHFLLACQIQQTKQMLMSRQKELAQIATDCGFAHQSHFTSRFKQATGLTPTRWRRLASQIAEGATAH